MSQLNITLYNFLKSVNLVTSRQICGVDLLAFLQGNSSLKCCLDLKLTQIQNYDVRHSHFNQTHISAYKYAIINFCLKSCNYICTNSQQSLSQNKC